MKKNYKYQIKRFFCSLLAFAIMFTTIIPTNALETKAEDDFNFDSISENEIIDELNFQTQSLDDMNLKLDATSALNPSGVKDNTHTDNNINLSKSARWIDIENGIAEITITETDKAKNNNITTQNDADTIVILDSSQSMDFMMDGASTCMNHNHYYQFGTYGDGSPRYCYLFWTEAGLYLKDLGTNNASIMPIGCQNGLSRVDNAWQSLYINCLINEQSGSLPNSQYGDTTRFDGFLWHEKEDGTGEYVEIHTNMQTTLVARLYIQNAIFDAEVAKNAYSWNDANGTHLTAIGKARELLRDENLRNHINSSIGNQDYYQGTGDIVPKFMYGTYSTMENPYNYLTPDNVNHFDNNGTPIGSTIKSPFPSGVASNSDIHNFMNGPGSISTPNYRWGYDNPDCFSKLELARQITYKIADQITSNGKLISYVPFAYTIGWGTYDGDANTYTNSENGTQYIGSTTQGSPNFNGSVANIAFCNWTNDLGTLASKLSVSTSEGATSFGTWYDHLAYLLKKHHEMGRDNVPINIIWISDGCATDIGYLDYPEDYDGRFTTTYTHYTQDLINDYPGEFPSAEEAFYREVLPFSLYALVNNQQYPKTAEFDYPNIGLGIKHYKRYKDYPTLGFKSNVTFHILGFGFINEFSKQYYTVSPFIMEDSMYVTANLLNLGKKESIYKRILDDNDIKEIDNFLFNSSSSTTSYNCNVHDKQIVDDISQYFELPNNQFSYTTNDGSSASFANGKVTWNVNTNTTESQVAHSLTFNVKLKDGYRYKEDINGTYYDTNGECKMTYNVDYIDSNDENKFKTSSTSLSISTPQLLYGAHQFNINKTFTTEDRPDDITFDIQRRFTNTNFAIVRKFVLSNSNNWTSGIFNSQDANGRNGCPFVAFDNNGNQYIYDIAEENIVGFKQKTKNTTNSSDCETYSFENQPYELIVNLYKQDSINYVPLDNAEFSIYSYIGSGDTSNFANYTPYRVPNMVETDNSIGKYSSGKLFYNNVNKGFFAIKETQAPFGYKPDTNTYFVNINTGIDSLTQAKTIYSYGNVIDGDNVSLKLLNTPSKSLITLTKKDPIHNFALVHDAVFTVYEWDGTGSYDDSANYVPYTSKSDNVNYFPTGYGSVNYGDVVTMVEDGNTGNYYTTDWLYYNQKGNLGHFAVRETTCDGFAIDENWYFYSASGQDTAPYDYELYTITNDNTWFKNIPTKGLVNLLKTDPVHNKPVHNAIFVVYEWNGNGNFNDDANYVPYVCLDRDFTKYPLTNEGQFVNTQVGDVVTVIDAKTKGTYQSTDYLYYDINGNQGHFLIKEITTPHGYYGDYKSTLNIVNKETELNETTGNKENDANKKESYKPHFITLSPVSYTSQEPQLFNIENNGTTFDNIPVDTQIVINKKGEVPSVTLNDDGSVNKIVYEDDVLSDAWYIVRATTDIYYPYQGESVLAYEKGDLVEVENNPYLHSLNETYYKNMLQKLHDSQKNVILTADYLLENEQFNKSFTASINNDIQNGIFNISWENASDEVDLHLVDPDGTIYDVDTYSEKIDITENSFEFTLDKIEKGNWNIIIQGVNLGRITVSILENDIEKGSYETSTSVLNNEKYYIQEYNVETQEIEFKNGVTTSKVYATDENGKIEINGLPLGTYEVIEVKAPAGYTRDTKNCSQMAVITCDNDYTQKVISTLDFYNTRQKIGLNGNSTPDDKHEVKTPEITISKVAQKYVYWNGDTIHYDIRVTNTGNTDLENVIINDYFENDEVVSLGTIEYLAKGESKDFEFEHIVPEDTKDKTKLTNYVTTEGIEVLSDEDVENEVTPRKVFDDDECKVIITDNGIAVVKESDKKTYVAGDIAYYTITVLNTTNNPLYNVTVEDFYVNNTLNSINFIDKEIEGITDCGDYVLIDEIEPNGTITLNYTVVVPNDVIAGDYDNLVVVKGEGTPYRIPHITITKKADKYLYQPGEDATYAITVLNDGEVALKDVKVSDILDGSFEDDKNIIGDLGINESITLTYTISIPNDIDNYENAKKIEKLDNVAFDETNTNYTYYQIDNIATVIGNGTHTNKDGDVVTTEVTNNDEETIYVIEKPANQNEKDVAAIKVIKELTSKYITMAGKKATYDITVINVGNVPITDIKLQDSLKGEWVDDITPFDLGVGEKRTFKYQYDIPEETKDGTIINNIAKVTGEAKIRYIDENDQQQIKNVKISDTDDATTIVKNNKNVTDEDTQIITVIDASIKINKTIDKKNYKVGDIAHYTVTVTNDGNTNLENVDIRDYQDGKFTKALTQTDKNIEIHDNFITIDKLDVNESISFEYEYIVKDSDSGNDSKNTVVVTATTPEDDSTTIIRVRDEDDEYIHVGKYVGVRKLGQTDIDTHPVEGALIGLYAEEDIFATADYDNNNKTPIIKANTLIETAYTNEYGYAEFLTDLPIGKYYAKELDTAKGYYLTDATTKVDAGTMVYNDQVEKLYTGGNIVDAQTILYVYLKDDTTFNELANANLQITDNEGNVEDVWITENTHDKGYAIYGLEPEVEYILTENYAREGYIKYIVRDFITGNGEIIEKTDDYVKFKIHQQTTSSDTNDKLDKTTRPSTVKLVITNDFAKGNARLNKQGEVLDSWNLIDKIKSFVKSIFNYILGNLKDVEFTIYAKEDIYHPDGITGIIYHKGDIVKEHIDTTAIDAIEVTDDAGNAYFENMYLGQYELVETKGINGYKELTEPIPFSIVYKNDTTPIVLAKEGTLNIINERQKIHIEALKLCTDTEIPVEGAIIGLYSYENIKDSNGEIIVKKDTLLESSISNKDGKVVFESDIPYGKYYLKEIEAPRYFKLNKTKFIIDVTEKDNKTSIMNFEIIIYDDVDEIEVELDKEVEGESKINSHLRYYFPTMRNNSPVPLEKATFVDDLPKEVKLCSVTTGTYNYETEMTIYYKLRNDNKWVEWEKVNTSASKTISVPENLDIESYKFIFKECPPKFSSVEVSSCDVVIRDDVLKTTKVTNNASFSGRYQSLFAKATDTVTTTVPATTTTTIIPDDKKPNTDDYMKFLPYGIGLGISLIGIYIYLRRRRI